MSILGVDTALVSEEARLSDPNAAAPVDIALFDTLARRYYAALYRYALSLTRCPDQASDLTQETMVRAFRRFGTYDRSRPFLYWLRRVAYHVFLDNLRLHRPPATVSLDALRELPDGNAPMVADVPDHTYNPEQILMHRTLEEWLDRSIRALPRDFRDALILCDVAGLSYREIAGALGCQIGTVSSRVHRARHLLRQALCEHAAVPS
ncbi:MAG: sigma-70 family RNA polymerase sigma factor [Chloroherpetonaceae bacterium]|nr:sigma-70 family RNA polymerase sigma factor [Chthonomonadaceae bacterium]MDW8207473.1 sigma-70 family RNA polymerase sigma factor [Chloroherpetonaceae bacterium]